MNKAIFLGLAAALALAGTQALAEGNAENGAKIVKKRCLNCHTIEKGGKKRVGPNLFGVYGSKPGGSKGYRYSKSYLQAAEKGTVWNDEAIFEYLASPKKFIRKVSGNPKARSKMNFKLKKEADRRDVIAYLKSQK